MTTMILNHFPHGLTGFSYEVVEVVEEHTYPTTNIVRKHPGMCTLDITIDQHDVEALRSADMANWLRPFQKLQLAVVEAAMAELVENKNIIADFSSYSTASSEPFFVTYHATYLVTDKNNFRFKVNLTFLFKKEFVLAHLPLYDHSLAQSRTGHILFGEELSL